MGIHFAEKVLLVATETTYGTIPELLAADAILASNIRIMPMEGQDTARDLAWPTLNASETIPTGLHAKLTFTAEILPSGTAGTAPVIGRLLRACGCAQVIAAGNSVTYNPVSRNHESAGIHLWIGDTRYALAGARGTATLRANAQAIPVIEFEFTGLWVQPTEATPIVPNLTTQVAAEVLVASSVNTPTFTVNGTALVMRSFSLALGNRVEPRFLVGSEAIRITGRSEMIETTVEARPVSAFNPYALALARTKVLVVLQHGTAAGRRFTLTAPAAQVQRLAGVEENQGLKEWPLRLVPQRTTGNDQWTLAFT